MEEMMMVMMNIRSHETTSSNNTHPHDINPIIIPSITTISPAWKLYENPFYNSDHNKQILQNHHQQQQQEYTDHNKQIHRLHLPISTRKIAASFWDLTFIKPTMESELEVAKSHVNELKAEMERERKARKKLEYLNKRIAKELSEERKGREALERVCEELAREISSDKTEMNRMKTEMQEERQMLRVAEVIREERVQMKLAEAKILMEAKFSQLDVAKKGIESSLDLQRANVDSKTSLSFGGKLKFVLAENRTAGNSVGQSMDLAQRRVCTEVENPHIKRGIKGFVEFPKVMRAIGCSSRSSSGKHLGSKLEGQKAQLKILLKQKEGVRFNGLIANS